jgi:DNA gyrase subunit A
MTDLGYIKRLPMDTYRIQRRGGRGIMGMTRREEDVVQTMFTCSTHDYVMFFTTKGRTYRLKGYEITEGSRTSKGMNIVNLLPVAGDERISAMIRAPRVEEGQYLCMVTRKGIIKRTALEAYKNVRVSGVIAINLDDDDELAWVRLTNGNDDLIVATRKGMCIRFNENDARPLGRTARGVKAITLRAGDEVVGMDVLKEGKTVLTVSETGYGRRSEPDNFRLQTRGGKGVINYKIRTYGDVASSIVVENDNDDLILISSDGIVIRIPAGDISVFARPSKGVRVMKVTPGERLVTVISAEAEEAGPDEAEPADDDTAQSGQTDESGQAEE